MAFRAEGSLQAGKRKCAGLEREPKAVNRP